MKKKIAIEEHFVPASLEPYTPAWGGDGIWPDLRRRLLDYDEVRLAEMDQFGIERAALSFSAPGIQGIPDLSEAIAIARQANDEIAAVVGRYPERYFGLAALPLQDPEAAIEELNRAVGTLGFKGILANGASEIDAEGNGVYYDAPQYLEFWQEVARLGVPFYMHPRFPLPGNMGLYEGREELLGPTWSFAVETGTHALRLLTSGLFDRVPDLTLILGHLGEFLPFAIERLQQRLAYYPGASYERSPREVLQENFYMTISGNYHTPSLLAVMLQVSADRILFATDYPFEKMPDGANWFDSAPISEADRLKIGRTNAEELFGL